MLKTKIPDVKNRELTQIGEFAVLWVYPGKWPVRGHGLAVGFPYFF